jgi:hypothetical protein
LVDVEGYWSKLELGILYGLFFCFLPFSTTRKQESKIQVLHAIAIIDINAFSFSLLRIIENRKNLRLYSKEFNLANGNYSLVNSQTTNRHALHSEMKYEIDLIFQGTYVVMNFPGCRAIPSVKP